MGREIEEYKILKVNSRSSMHEGKNKNGNKKALDVRAAEATKAQGSRIPETSCQNQGR
jgi:hypothetical protein